MIRLNHERFSVPEILFRPSDVAINEMGVSEMIVHSINKCPEGRRMLQIFKPFFVNRTKKFKSFDHVWPKISFSPVAVVCLRISPLECNRTCGRCCLRIMTLKHVYLQSIFTLVLGLLLEWIIWTCFKPCWIRLARGPQNGRNVDQQHGRLVCDKERVFGEGSRGLLWQI